MNQVLLHFSQISQHLLHSSHFACLTELSMIFSMRNAKWLLQNSSRCKLGCQIKSNGIFFFWGLIWCWCYNENCQTEVKKQGSSRNSKTELQLIATYVNIFSFCCELWQGIQPNTALTQKLVPTSIPWEGKC